MSHTLSNQLIKISIKATFWGSLLVYGPAAVATVVGTQVLVGGTIAMLSGMVDHVVNLVV